MSVRMLGRNSSSLSASPVCGSRRETMNGLAREHGCNGVTLPAPLLSLDSEKSVSETGRKDAQKQIAVAIIGSVVEHDVLYCTGSLTTSGGMNGSPPRTKGCSKCARLHALSGLFRSSDSSEIKRSGAFPGSGAGGRNAI